jgi:hypothetical protein
MKFKVLALNLAFALIAFGQQKELVVKTGPNLGSLSGDKNENSGSSESQYPLFGWQLGAGASLPTNWNFINELFQYYYSPMLYWTQGGQGYKFDESKYGIKNNYINLANTVGGEYQLENNDQVFLETGPSFNYWAGAKSFSKFQGEKNTSKIELKDNENVNQAYLSWVVEGGYEFDLSRTKLKLGLRGDFGLTPIESYDNFEGGKTKLKPQNVGITVGVSNPFGDLLGEDKYGEYVGETIEIDEGLLQAENIYEMTVYAYKKARELKDKSLSTTDKDSSKYYAEQALEWIEKAEKWLKEGTEDWANGDDGGVGPTSSALLVEYISEIRKCSQTMADSVWAEIPGEDDGDNPRDTPPPTQYGEEIDPPWIKHIGAFTPTQGVWQDDKTFADKKTKQLTKIEDNVYHAELDMVANRWTVVTGIREEKRYIIKMSGTSTYTKEVPVKFRLKLKQNGGERIIWTSENINGWLPIEGGPGPERPWEVSVLKVEGAPIPKSFKMEKGGYTLELELIKNNGDETGLKVQVSGLVVNTSFPVVNLVPVSIGDENTVAGLRTLKDRATSLAEECRQKLHMYYPVPSNSIEVKAHPIENLDNTKLTMFEYLEAKVRPSIFQENVRQDKVIATLTEKFSTQSQVNGGKVVVLTNENDFKLIYMFPENTSAFAASNKVVFLKGDKKASTVGHELLHTFPHLWSEDEMQQYCDKNYHNNNDEYYGAGADVWADRSKLIESETALMGPTTDDKHITQCSYWYLLGALQKGVDPELYIVRGLLFKNGDYTEGVLGNTYEIMGDEELQPTGLGDAGWGINLKNEEGNVLATYPLNPVWKATETEGEHFIVGFSHRINRVKGTKSIELVGPGGILETQKVTAARPKLKIITPAKNSAVTPENGKLKVSWEAEDRDGDTLSYLVYYSPDGISWRTIAHDIQETEIDMDIYGFPTNPQIKILATDGVRTDEKIVKFIVARP